MKKLTMGLLLGVFVSASFIGCGEDTKEANSDGVEQVEAASEEIVQPDLKCVSVLLAGGEEENQKKRESFEIRLTEEGHEVSVLTAGGDAALQVSQIKDVLASGTDVLVIEPVDAYGLTAVLESAGEQDIPVISYDTLIMDSKDVSYYTTYSYREMGHLVGEAIKKQNQLDEAAEKQLSYQIEFLMGSQDSLEALFFYNGVMEILKGYFDAGVLVCPSGNVSFDATGVLRWDENQALLRFDEILENYYQEDLAPDIVCTGFDGAALSAVKALEAAGCTPDSDVWPMITGVGYSEQADEAIQTGKIYGSICTDEEVLIETCIKMAAACAKDEKPETNDAVQYDNGVKIIEANVCEAKFITAESIKEETKENAEENVVESTEPATDTEI